MPEMVCQSLDEDVIEMVVCVTLVELPPLRMSSWKMHWTVSAPDPTTRRASVEIVDATPTSYPERVW